VGRRKRLFGPGCLSFLVLVALAVVLAFTFRVPILTALAKPLVEDDGPRKADAILVMGGDEFCTRILKAGQLAQAGYAPTVLVSSPPVFTAHESDFTIPYAVKHGYPATLFQPIPSSVDSTGEEAKLIGQVLRQHNVHTVLLVTSNYHTARAARTVRKQNPWLTLYVEPAPDPFFSTDTWWRTRTGKKTFALEWTKTLAAEVGV
jgi:uncharacterized SAM-binding protein YcdF (DUF218 family)